MPIPTVKIEVLQTQSDLLARDIEMLGPEKALEEWIAELREENPAVEQWMNNSLSALEEVCKAMKKGKPLVELETAQTTAILLFLSLYRAIRAQIEINELDENEVQE